MPKIIENNIFQTIKHFWTQKAPRPDHISNKVLKIIVIKIYSYLQQIFNNFFTLFYYLLYFKKSAIIILCKHKNNKNFTSLKIYRFIFLLNLISKIIEAILATKISYIVTAYNLLPKTHFVSWQKSCIITAIYNL